MEHRSFKTLALIALTALTLGGTALVAAGPVQAQVRGGYALDDDDEDFDRQRIQRRALEDDLEDDRPRARHRIANDHDDDDRTVIERRTVERRTIERRVVQPVVQRQVVVQRPVYEPRPVVQKVVVRPVVRTVVARPVVERRFIQPVVERRVVRPIVQERHVVRLAAPIEECRTIVKRRTNDFGDTVVTRIRSCD